MEIINNIKNGVQSTVWLKKWTLGILRNKFCNVYNEKIRQIRQREVSLWQVLLNL